MMRKLGRGEVVDYVTWTAIRPEVEPDVRAVKAPRRITVGPLTFLFENTATVRWQVQEMMRVERIVREKDIQHEIDTYNELLGGPGELGCVLLIEVPTAEERAVKLREWLQLPSHLYVELDDGTRVRASYDERQVGDNRVSAVQYIKFDTGGRVPVALGSDLPALDVRGTLTPAQRTALADDLALEGS